jgi:hypothetical protein
LESLEVKIRKAADVLEFKPTMEAKLPKGFPQPTPVGEIRVKKYPTYRAAQTAMGTGRDGAFWTLFQHISTNQIEMTAPVEMTYRRGPQAGDAPKEATMAFLYGDPKIGAAGSDGNVRVVDNAPRSTVCIGMCGEMSPSAIKQGRLFLSEWLAEHKHQYDADGELRVLGYNSPFIPVEKRYFEVEIPIRDISQNQKPK